MTPVQFTFDRLVEYSDEAILAEIKRVAALVAPEPIDLPAFKRHANVGMSTVRRHFGTWRAALAAAGIRHVLDHTKPLTRKMTSQQARGMSNEQLLQVLVDVAHTLGKDWLTQGEFNRQAPINASTLSRRFGGWGDAHQRAGLDRNKVPRQFSDDDCFDNLLKVWTHVGRAPKLEEMSRPPSLVGIGPYLRKWKTWRRALKAFVDRVNSDLSASTEETSSSLERGPTPSISGGLVTEPNVVDPRAIRVGLRYQVLKRDRFSCVLCGRSPANHPGLELHVDHIVPYSLGGRAVLENLRSACRDCNLGKGAKVEN